MRVASSRVSPPSVSPAQTYGDGTSRWRAFSSSRLTWQYVAIRWVAMKDKDFAILVTGMAIDAIVGATWLTVLDSKIEALDRRLGAMSKFVDVQSETIRNICDTEKAGLLFDQSVHSRLKALEAK